MNPPNYCYGYILINEDNAKQFEPKQATDEFLDVEGIWNKITPGYVAYNDRFSAEMVYRRKITIPDGWELVPAETNCLVGNYRVTNDGSNWRDEPNPSCGLTIASLNAASLAKFLAVIRKKQSNPTTVQQAAPKRQITTQQAITLYATIEALLNQFAAENAAKDVKS